MCGFVVCTDSETFDDQTIRRRGPDFIGRLHRGGLSFTHYLLHVTGERFPQPFVDGDIVCVYNGEIYNMPFSRSDGEVLIPMYRELGPGFARELDGEFAIALYDFGRRRAVFVTDPFGSKPLWSRKLRAASYGRCINGRQMPPNTLRVVSFDGGETDELLHRFDFSNQFKSTFDDWVAAFETAIRKRATPDCFIGLSSGYDSGAIAAALRRLYLPFASYSILGSEDRGLLERRVQLVGGMLLDIDQDLIAWCQKFLKANVEEYCYANVTGVRLPAEWMTDDCGAEGSCALYLAAARDGRRVVLSGQGADELFADYPFWPEVSSLGGVFPAKLDIWPNFFGGCQQAYLAKEEHVAGAFGIEARYPYLDRQVVQEFLWLTPALKNSLYKAPLHHYLSLTDFPFQPGVKRGFSAAPGPHAAI